MLTGHVEQYTPGCIAGWALNQDLPANPEFVHLFIDSDLYATTKACLPRSDHRGPPCGFKFLLPPELAVGPSRRLVSVHFERNGQPLANAPRYVNFSRRNRRALVLSPAGNRYNHDSVRAYDRPRSEMITKYWNTGDWTVYDSSLKLLSFSDVVVANMVNPTDREIDSYNAEFDYCFLRGSNYLNESFDWLEAPRLLERLNIPVIAFAVGLQAEQPRRLKLPEKTVRTWKLFADHAASIGVRGTLTAEALHDIGIDNVDVIGCPSLFRCNNPYLRIAPKPLDQMRKIAFSLRREVSASYSSDPARYLAIQKDFIRRLDQRFDLTLTTHGEPAEKAFFFRDNEFLPQYREELLRSGWFESPDDRLVEIYENRLFFNTSVADYDAFIRTRDLALGFRVHGNLPALANQVPAIFVDYDQRSRELADTFSIPCMRLEEMAERDLDGIYSTDMFDAFNARYPANYRQMATFLERNGIPHNMHLI